MHLKILNVEPSGYSVSAVQIWKSNGFSYLEKDWHRISSEEIFDDIDILIVRLQKRIDMTILRRFPSLKMIISATTGSDHLDMESLQSAGIELVSLRDHTNFLKTIPSTAEFTWALICALIRNLPAAYEDVALGNWNRDKFRGFQLYNKKIGIIGLGRVGQKVAKYGNAFDMHVGYYDPFVDSTLHLRYNSLDELLESCDIITVHVHLNEDSYHLLNHDNLSKVKKGSLLINTSRGNVWDEEALVDVFNTGKIKGIASDVLSDELGVIHKSALWRLQQKGANVIITPHIGGATYDAMWSCEEYLASYVVSLSNPDKVDIYRES